MRLIAVLTLAAISAVACLHEIKNAIASCRAATNSVAGLRSAASLTPADADLWSRLGVALLRDKAPGSEAAFAKALDLNPYDTNARLGLAVQYELGGNARDAERHYVAATEYSHRFRPLSALAAFYYRRNRLSDFWKTSARAANVNAADITPILDLALESGVSPDRIPALLRLSSGHASAAYLQLALNKRLVSEAAGTAIEAPVTDETRPLLLSFCEQLIEAGDHGNAVLIWNKLARAGVPGIDALEPAAGRSLTNPEFRPDSAGAFDWKLASLPGTNTAPGATKGIAIQFSGDQPEQGSLLHQVMPVLPNRTYRLTLRYDTVGLCGPTGLSASVEHAGNGTPARIARASLPASADGSSTMEFTTPDNCSLIRLTIRYQRDLGTTRITGTLNLVSAGLELRS